MLKKFSIIDDASASGETNMLLNLNHIVSVKPIKMTAMNQKVIDGFWIRLSNGKKYRASRVPTLVEELFIEPLSHLKINESLIHDLNMQ